jgi:hypothetical protein
MQAARCSAKPERGSANLNSQLSQEEREALKKFNALHPSERPHHHSFIPELVIIVLAVIAIVAAVLLWGRG